jgi:hypothetical protein
MDSCPLCLRPPSTLARGESAKVAVNAQHYAVLVTDVAQWPYPELQRCGAARGAGWLRARVI